MIMQTIPVEIVNTDWFQIGSNIILALAAVAAFVFSFITYRNNLKYTRKQQFESTFFSMLNQLENITSKLTLEVIADSVIREEELNTYKVNRKIADPRLVKLTGKDVFEGFFDKKLIKINNQELNKEIEKKNINILDSSLSQRIQGINEFKTVYYEYFEYNSYTSRSICSINLESALIVLGIKAYISIKEFRMFDHYFRYIYRILKFVDESEHLEKKKKYIDERYKYTSILRATLSPYELVFLFYNGLFYEKSKYYLEKYTMLKNLRPELTAQSYRDYDLNFINNEDKDYYKYISGIDCSVEFDKKIEPYKSYVVEKKDNPYIENKE